jgi:hypothetical protein
MIGQLVLKVVGGRSGTYQVVELDCGYTLVYTRDDFHCDGSRVDMFGIQSIAQPRDTGCDLDDGQYGCGTGGYGGNLLCRTERVPCVHLEGQYQLCRPRGDNRTISKYIPRL